MSLEAKVPPKTAAPVRQAGPDQRGRAIDRKRRCDKGRVALGRFLKSAMDRVSCPGADLVPFILVMGFGNRSGFSPHAILLKIRLVLDGFFNSAC